MVVTVCRHVECRGEVLPARLLVERGCQPLPARGHIGIKGRRSARRLVAGDKEGHEIVEAAFAVSLPVERDGVVTGSETHGAVGIYVRGAIKCVAVDAAIVIGDVQALRATLRSGGAYVPFVGIGAVVEFPDDILACLEASEVGHGGRDGEAGGVGGVVGNGNVAGIIPVAIAPLYKFVSVGGSGLDANHTSDGVSAAAGDGPLRGVGGEHRDLFCHAGDGTDRKTLVTITLTDVNHSRRVGIHIDIVGIIIC